MGASTYLYDPTAALSSIKASAKGEFGYNSIPGPTSITSRMVLELQEETVEVAKVGEAVKPAETMGTAGMVGAVRPA
jgi:hypothetical protein